MCWRRMLGDVTRKDVKYVKNLIRRKAMKMTGSYGFSLSDKDDIKQELLLDLYVRLKHYDREKGDFRGFVRLLVNNKISSLIAAKKAQMRDYRKTGPSLNQVIEIGEGEHTYLHETLTQDDYLRITGKSSQSDLYLNNLSLDIHHTTENMPIQLKELCELLKEYDISDASRKLAINRDTVYEWIKRIKQHFMQGGLDSYL